MFHLRCLSYISSFSLYFFFRILSLPFDAQLLKETFLLCRVLLFALKQPFNYCESVDSIRPVFCKKTHFVLFTYSFNFFSNFLFFSLGFVSLFYRFVFCVFFLSFFVYLNLNKGLLYVNALKLNVSRLS